MEPKLVELEPKLVELEPKLVELELRMFGFSFAWFGGEPYGRLVSAGIRNLPKEPHRQSG